jgi:transposase
MLSEKQIRDRIWELQKEIEVLKFVLNNGNTNENVIKSNPPHRPKGSIKYTKEQVEFLKDCLKNKLKDKEIIDLYNLKFKTNLKKNSRALYNFTIREGLRQINYSPKKFNDEEDKFILENYTKLSQQEIANKLNRTRDTIKNRLNLLLNNKFKV